MYTYTYAHTYMYTCIHMHVHKPIHIRIHEHTHKHEHIHTYTGFVENISDAGMEVFSTVLASSSTITSVELSSECECWCVGVSEWLCGCVGWRMDIECVCVCVRACVRVCVCVCVFGVFA